MTSADFREALGLVADLRACINDAPHRYGCTCPLCPGRRTAPILSLPWRIERSEATASRDPR